MARRPARPSIFNPKKWGGGGGGGITLKSELKLMGRRKVSDTWQNLSAQKIDYES